MRRHARVVVIGGGNMGAAVLYHLAREGWSDSLLIEKAELTSGATGPVSGKSLVFAFLAPEGAQPGTRLEVSILGERRPARVLSGAVQDPNDERLRA